MVDTQPKPHKNAHSKFSASRVFTLNTPNAPRLNPALAVEIGLNESILFLQLEFLIAVSSHEREGKRWTYQSVTDLEQMFPFWGRATIHRTVKSLEAQNLIYVGNFNDKKYDRTRWFAINMDQANQLQSICIGRYETDLFHFGTGSNQNGTELFQNGTTIPETTTKITKKEKEQANLVTLDPTVFETGNLPASFAVASGQETEEHGKGIGSKPIPPFPPFQSQPLIGRLRLSLGQATDNFLKWAAAYTDAEIDAALTELLTRKNINSPVAMLKVLLRDGWSKQKKTGSTKKSVEVPINDLEFEKYAQRFRNQPALAAIRFCADHGADDRYTKSLVTHLFVNAKQKSETLFKIFQLHKQHSPGSVISPLNSLRGLVGVSPLTEDEEERNRLLWITQNRSNAA